MSGTSRAIQACGHDLLRTADGQAGLGFNSSIIRALIKRLTRVLGYELVPRGEAAGRQLASHLEELFRRLEIDCVFDVGANAGQYRDFLRYEIGYSGYVVSVEPIPENAEKLIARAKSDPRWVIEAIALGSESGWRSFNVMKNSVFSSFLEPADHVAGENEIVYRADVETRMLDEVFKHYRQEIGFRRPYLKLDTQGSDLEILKGGRSVLPEFRALQTEISFIAIYQEMPNYLETIQFLNEQGYDATCFSAVNRDEQLRIIEADCVMVNRNLR